VEVAKDVCSVTTPDGRCFTIFLGAPGSLLDSGSEALPGGGWLGVIELLVHVGHIVGRSARKGWRLDVEPLGMDGHLGGALYRERVADEEAAEKRSADLAALIETGEWDPASFQPPPMTPS
jgi:hypothetical protein